MRTLTQDKALAVRAVIEKLSAYAHTPTPVADNPISTAIRNSLTTGNFTLRWVDDSKNGLRYWRSDKAEAVALIYETEVPGVKRIQVHFGGSTEERKGKHTLAAAKVIAKGLLVAAF